MTGKIKKVERINIKKLVGILVITLLTISISCETTEKETVEETIKIGAIIPLTGDLSSFGETMAKAIRLAEKEINEGGGVLGKKISVEMCDDRTTPEGARKCFDDLTAKNIKFIIGPATSSAIIKGICGGNPPSCDYIKQKRALIISPSATSPLISTLDDDGLIWRNAPSDAFQGKILAELMRGKIKPEIISNNISVIYRNDAWGKSLADVFKAEFERLGGNILSYVSYPEEKDSGFSGEIAKAYENGEPESLVLVTFATDGLNLLKDLKSYIASQGKPKPKLFGTDGNKDTSITGDPTVADLIKENFTGTAPSAPLDDPIYKAFSDKYRQSYGASPEIYNENVYDCVYIIALGIQAAGEYDPDKVKNKIISITSGGEKVSPVSAGGRWKEIIDKISQGADIDYDGASGGNEFEENGDTKSGVYIIWKVIGNEGKEEDFGKIETVKK